MKNLILSALVMAAAAGLARADDLTPTAQAGAWDRVVLKDGQKMEGRIRGHDAFFLDIESRNGTELHLPWPEILEVAPAEFTGASAFYRQNMTADNVKVTSVIEPRSPSAALGKAFWPGFFIHGYGHKEAGDTDMFLSLAGAELFGALVAGFGASKVLDAGVAQGDKDTAQYLVWGGGGVFILSWIWDIAGAPGAARAYNERHKVAFDVVPAQRGVMLGMSTRF